MVWRTENGGTKGTGKCFFGAFGVTGTPLMEKEKQGKAEMNENINFAIF